MTLHRHRSNAGVVDSAPSAVYAVKSGLSAALLASSTCACVALHIAEASMQANFITDAHIRFDVCSALLTFNTMQGDFTQFYFILPL